ncbi:MAG TPA: hypothetical protein VFM75_05180 [Modicisalibacter sp.]|nr:hypothetical protein [Modicisalibacter sp.]
MLISDSIPLLWLVYVALSLVVLVTGYLAIRWLPRLPRFVVTGVVAGMLWMPAGFTIPVLEDEVYAGLAPAIVVAAVAVLQGAWGDFGAALPLLLLGLGLGAGAGVLLWGWLRRRNEHDSRDDNIGGGGKTAVADKRREPVIG